MKGAKPFGYLTEVLSLSKPEAGACSDSDFLSTMRKKALLFLIML